MAESGKGLRPLVLDASVAINLLATGQPWSILTALGFRAHVPEQVLREVVRCPITQRAYSDEKHPFRISPNVEIVQLASAEVEDFVAIAQHVGDGEAASIAVALARKLPLALDDRRARSTAKARDGTIGLIWTTELLRHPTLKAAFSADDIDAFFADAIRHARMYVPKDG
jgi:predicted nucleic acid-binding protein